MTEPRVYGKAKEGRITAKKERKTKEDRRRAPKRNSSKEDRAEAVHVKLQGNFQEGRRVHRLKIFYQNQSG